MNLKYKNTFYNNRIIKLTLNQNLSNITKKIKINLFNFCKIIINFKYKILYNKKNRKIKIKNAKYNY